MPNSLFYLPFSVIMSEKDVNAAITFLAKTQGMTGIFGYKSELWRLIIENATPSQALCAIELIHHTPIATLSMIVLSEGNSKEIHQLKQLHEKIKREIYGG